MLPEKILKFRVSEMPSPGFCAGQATVFRKEKKYKNNEDRSQAKDEASTLKMGKLRDQPVNIHVLMFMYMKDC